MHIENIRKFLLIIFDMQAVCENSPVFLFIHSCTNYQKEIPRIFYEAYGANLHKIYSHMYFQYFDFILEDLKSFGY